MEGMSDMRKDTLTEGAEPVNNEEILDLIQTDFFGEIGCGPLCRVNSLTDSGKRFQLFKILCLTVIPILGVWGFTMYSLTDSVQDKSDIEAAQRSMSVVVMLGSLIHRLQTERDMSVLYLSDLGPGTKTFLLAEYLATDDALQKLTVWPGELEANPREEFRSKSNLMTYIAHHRTSLNPKQVDLYEEIGFYTSITSEFLEWLIENIKGSGFGTTWKILVAYQKITRCKEEFGVERAYGAMFYANGSFPRWVDFEFYNDQVHKFKYNYKTAVFYAAIVDTLLKDEEKDLLSFGINITSIISAFRFEIQYHSLNKSYHSDEVAKWYFDNMTEYMDSLLSIQERIASRISFEVGEFLTEVLTKVIIYASLVVVVISMCPVIMMSSEGLASDIQRFTQTLVEQTRELNKEKFKTDTLLYQMVPKSVAERLKSNGSVESEFFKSVTICFSSIHDFNRISAALSPTDLVTLLNDLYRSLDLLIENYDVYKVETINDSYMIASGVPKRNNEGHAAEIANMSLKILRMIQDKSYSVQLYEPLKLKTGMHTGPVSAGVIGNMMPRYCLFGQSINVASQMKYLGAPNQIHISEATKHLLEKNGKFKLKYRGELEIKGRIIVNTFWLLDWSSFPETKSRRNESHMK